MAAAVGEVIFRAGEETLDHSDVWDDTALIEAYDRAVNAVKSGDKDKGSGKQRKPNFAKKKETKKHGSTEMSSSGWKVGDACRAVFTGGDQVYDAVIVSIEYKSQLCVVRYDDYENEEEQQLQDLIPPAVRPVSKQAKKQPAHKGVESGRHQTGDWSGQSMWQVSDICLAQEPPSGHYHEAVINAFPTTYTCQVTFVRSRQRQEVNISNIYPSSGARSGPHLNTHQTFGPGFAHPSPMWPPFPSGGFVPTPPVSTQVPWPPMPPPPAPVNTKGSAVDDDALASMLMSWYLTGYHTGYYQALQSIRQGTNKDPTEVTKGSATEKGKDESLHE